VVDEDSQPALEQTVEIAAQSAYLSLHPRKRVFVDQLARGYAVSTICRNLAITPPTAYKWKAEPQVQRALTLRQLETYEQGANETLDLLPDVIKVLRGIMTGVNRDGTPFTVDREGHAIQESARDRIAAAKVLIQSHNEIKLRETLELKVIELEQRLFAQADITVSKRSITGDAMEGLTYGNTPEDVAELRPPERVPAQLPEGLMGDADTAPYGRRPLPPDPMMPAIPLEELGLTDTPVVEDNYDYGYYHEDE
jgi:hypothetical protein